MDAIKLDVIRAEMLRSLQRSRDAEERIKQIIEDERRLLAATLGKSVAQLTADERITARVRAYGLQTVMDAEVMIAQQLDRTRTYALVYQVEADVRYRGRGNQVGTTAVHVI